MDRRNALKKTGLLAGAAVAMPSLFSILQSCKDEPRATWQPLFFTLSEANTVSTMVDMILPRTDTPGALDVKADVFIDRVFAKTYGEEDQEKMRNEIAGFNADCKKNHGKPFYELNREKREAVLKAAEKSSGKINPGIWGKTVGDQKPVGFYRVLKSMAIWAYFTSEEIGENVLRYLPVPGEYEGCIALSPADKRWSL